jgi:hypothetical protein
MKYHAIFLGHGVIAGFLTLFFLNLVGSRWTYYDIGINATTRGITLLCFVSPIIFMVLIAGAAFAWWKLCHHQVQGDFFGLELPI